MYETFSAACVYQLILVLLSFSFCKTQSCIMSDTPPTQPFLVCDCGYITEFLATLRRHQYTFHDGLVGHHTQLPRRPPRNESARSRRCARGQGGATAPRARAADGNVVDDESDEPSTPPSTGSPTASSDTASTSDSAVESQLRTLLELTRVWVPPTHGGGAAADAIPEYLYSSVGLHVRALYEALGDAVRGEPLVHRRKRAKVGRFNTIRLRALQRFVLQAGGAGLSEKDQQILYEFLDVWDGTKAGMAEDAGHHATLRETFPSVKAFKDALRDDLDDAALGAGWKKVKLVEGGVPYEAYFRDVLQVIRKLIKRKGGSIQLWSGPLGPAPLDDKRETPMDGEAFKICEQLVMGNTEELACVLGLHVYSDSSQLSWSGGMFQCVCYGVSYLDRFAHVVLLHAT